MPRTFHRKKRGGDMDIAYKRFEASDLDTLVKFYMDHYNAKGGTWTYETAYKRLHQMVTIEDSLVLLQFEDKELVGFLMGYFKYFDDSTGFFLEEILVADAHQNQGYGTELLAHLKAELTAAKCNWIELLTTTGEQHQGFYKKNGYKRSENLVLEFLDL